MSNTYTLLDTLTMLVNYKLLTHTIKFKIGLIKLKLFLPERKHFKRTFLIPCKYFLWQRAMCGSVYVAFVLNITLKATWRCVLVLHKSSWGYTSIPYQCVYTHIASTVCFAGRYAGWVLLFVLCIWCVCLVSARYWDDFFLWFSNINTDNTYTTHHIRICEDRYGENPIRGIEYEYVCVWQNRDIELLLFYESTNSHFILRFRLVVIIQ